MREQRMWCMKEWSLIKLSVPGEKTCSWQTRCRQQGGKCELLWSVYARINSRSVHCWYQWHNSDYETTKWLSAAFFFLQNGRLRLFWIILENHFWSHFSPFQINTQHFFLNYLRTNWPCWTAVLMTEHNFWSHFSPFQINTQLFF